MPSREIEPALGQTAESLDALPLLAATLQADGVAAPVVDGLAAVVEGRLEAETWAAGVTAPARAKRAKAA
jgi:glycerol-3-phosphate dehydrogenase